MKHTPGPWKSIVDDKQPSIYYKGLICFLEDSTNRVSLKQGQIILDYKEDMR
jgi:hypothetical protein